MLDVVYAVSQQMIIKCGTMQMHTVHLTEAQLKGIQIQLDDEEL